jgi:hypothetical protein
VHNFISVVIVYRVSSLRLGVNTKNVRNSFRILDTQFFLTASVTIHNRNCTLFYIKLPGQVFDKKFVGFTVGRGGAKSNFN